MGTDTTITIGAVALLITLFIAIFNFYDARRKKAKEEGREEGIVSTKLDTILTELKSLSTQIEQLDVKTNELSHKVNNHESRIGSLEKKRVKPITE